MESLELNRPTCPLRLRKRDQDILSYLGQNQFAPMSFLRKLFFENKNDQSDYRRLKQLSRMGLVEPLSSHRGHQLCYRLTEKGIHSLRVEGIQSGFQVRRKNYGTSQVHDTHMLSVRELLESQPCISNYYAEQEVRSLLAERHGYQAQRDQLYKVPDAIFTLKLPDRTLRVALELELNAKSLTRLKRQYELLAASTDFESTFWIVGSDKLLARLMQVLSDLRRDDFHFKMQAKSHGFYFTTLSDLLSKQAEATFSSEETSFTLDQLSKLRFETPKQMPEQLPK